MRIDAVVLRCLVGLSILAMDTNASDAISLREALTLSVDRDPWIERSNQIQTALDARGEAAASLPDPVVSLGMVNLPTDSFDFNQEPMTQARVGISQHFPRGDSRKLRRQKFSDLSGQQPLERIQRRAHVQREVTRAWLQVYRAQRAVDLIESDRSLFDYLVDLTRSRYTSVQGATQQQDVVRAELELTRLEDRLYRLRTLQEQSLATLVGWLTDSQFGSEFVSITSVSEEAPSVVLVTPALTTLSPVALDAFLADHLQQSPRVRSLDQRIAASHTDRELAEQAYKPGFSVNASYGYRDDTPMGDTRADFFSVGVALELPLYSSSRQDFQVRAAVADREALLTDRSLLLRDLRSGVHTHVARLVRLEQRAELYETQLLRQMAEQSEAYLSAYRADEADFDEVVGARIDELNARIDALNIDVDLAETTAELNYLLATVPSVPEEDR